jgi:hypothetical protein
MDGPDCLSPKRKRMAELRDRTPEMQLTATPERRLQLCFNCIPVTHSKRVVCRVLAYSFVFFTGRGYDDSDVLRTDTRINNCWITGRRSEGWQAA